MSSELPGIIIQGQNFQELVCIVLSHVVNQLSIVRCQMSGVSVIQIRSIVGQLLVSQVKSSQVVDLV